MPTLILWGEHDSVFSRADQDALLAGIHGATLTVYRHIGHSPHWESPDRFVRDVSEFLGRIES